MARKKAVNPNNERAVAWKKKQEKRRVLQENLKNTVLLTTQEELQEKTEELSLEQLKTRNRERQLERGQIENKRRRKAESDCDSIESLGAVLLTTQEELQEKKEELCLEQLKKENRKRQNERAQTKNKNDRKELVLF